MKKLLLLDLAIVIACSAINFIISVVTEILLTDLFFWAFIAFLLTSVIMIGLSRHEMRRAAKEKDGKVKDDHRKSFKWHESLSFNFFMISVIFFVFSLTLVA